MHVMKRKTTKSVKYKMKDTEEERRGVGFKPSPGKVGGTIGTLND